DYLYILLSAVIALNGAMVGSVIWLARQDRPIGERHYRMILDREDILEDEIRQMKKELKKLREKAV
ncbi:MAG: hypothetical protein ACE5EA_10880, partial [Nitrospirota bacterium]